jgi:hypothetical protein
MSNINDPKWEEMAKVYAGHPIEVKTSAEDEKALEEANLLRMKQDMEWLKREREMEKGKDAAEAYRLAHTCPSCGAPIDDNGSFDD